MPLLIPPGGNAGGGVRLHLPGAVAPLGEFLLQGAAFDLPRLSQPFPFKNFNNLGHTAAGDLAAQLLQMQGLT